MRRGIRREASGTRLEHKSQSGEKVTSDQNISRKNAWFPIKFSNNFHSGGAHTEYGSRQAGNLSIKTENDKQSLCSVGFLFSVFLYQK